MRPKSLLLLALALGCGLVASIGISQVMDRNANRPAAKTETVPIYVALHNINTGDPIDASMLSLQEWPKDKVPHGAVSNLEDLEGRRPRSAIIEGEPILEAKLLAAGQMADPIRSIPKGYRLKTIKVDAEKSAAGLLGPGDRVDIQLFVRRDTRNGIESAKSKVILQNIRVFAVDQTVQRSADGSEERTVAKTVSLLLTPDQASKLGLAENLGEVSLIPRNPDDEDTGTWAEYSADDLLGTTEAGSREKEQGVDDQSSHGTDLLSAVRQTVPPPRPPFIMEIVEAQDVREMRFDPETGKPIREQPAAPNTAGPGLGERAGSSSTPADDLGTTPKQEMEQKLENFPIDFEQPN
jgi:pilus assembly protein CpaB